MSDTETQTEHKQPRAAKNERVYHRSRLVHPTEGPRIAGVSRSVLAGALALADQRKANFTRADIDKAVDAYRTREVPAAKEDSDR